MCAHNTEAGCLVTAEHGAASWSHRAGLEMLTQPNPSAAGWNWAPGAQRLTHITHGTGTAHIHFHYAVLVVKVNTSGKHNNFDSF